tara:strand:+ start:364 stop:765 length:402 start_codon:yes stop_codon:yes gene_type:complete
MEATMKLVRTTLLVFGIVFGTSSIIEASQLPSCPWFGKKHNCYGKETYVDGDKYVGEWRDDKRHGQGTHTSLDGSITEGIWENGFFLHTIQERDRKLKIKKAEEEAREEQKRKERAWNREFDRAVTRCLYEDI